MKQAAGNTSSQLLKQTDPLSFYINFCSAPEAPLSVATSRHFFSAGILKITVAKSCGRNVVEHALEIFCNSLFLSGTLRPSFNCGNISKNDPLV